MIRQKSIQQQILLFDETDKRRVKKGTEVLTLHFRMQQLTCEVHLIVARAMGPIEALAEQYFAPCLLLCQPPEKIQKK